MKLSPAKFATVPAAASTVRYIRLRYSSSVAEVRSTSSATSLLYPTMSPFRAVQTGLSASATMYVIVREAVAGWA